MLLLPSLWRQKIGYLPMSIAFFPENAIKKISIVCFFLLLLNQHTVGKYKTNILGLCDRAEDLIGNSISTGTCIAVFARQLHWNIKCQ
jgi:hypothetical protein